MRFLRWTLALPLFGLVVGPATRDAAGGEQAQWAQTIRLEPSGGDDTAQIQGALDECVARGRGCAIRLAEGTFRTSQVAATGFEGSIRGAGRSRTVIEANPQLYVDPYWLLTFTTGRDIPILITLTDSDVLISDLTLSFPHPAATTLWHTSFGMDFTALWGGVGFTGREAKARVARVNVVGVPGDWFGFNQGNPFMLVGPSHYELDPSGAIQFVGFSPVTGSLSIFDTSGSVVDCLAGVARVTHASILMTRSSIDTAEFLYVSDHGVSTTDVRLSHNSAKNIVFAGVGLFLSGPNQGTHSVEVTDNRFEIAPPHRDCSWPTGVISQPSAFRRSATCSL